MPNGDHGYPPPPLWEQVRSLTSELDRLRKDNRELAEQRDRLTRERDDLLRRLGLRALHETAQDPRPRRTKS